MVYRVKPHERLALAITRKGWTGSKLARELGITQPALHPVLTGNQPGTKHLPRIAELLGCSVEWITAGDNPPSWASSATTYVKSPEGGLPVIGTVSAGDGDVGPADWEDAPQRAIHWPDSWVAVKILGDSAYPVAYSGQLAIVDQGRAVNPAIHHGEDLEDLHDNMVLVQTMEGDRERAYLKRFCVDSRAPDGFVLASVNSGRSSPYLPASLILAILPVVGIIYEDPRQKRVKGRNRAVIKT